MMFGLLIVSLFFSLLSSSLLLVFCLLGGVTSSREPRSSYECGFEPLSRVRPRFCIQFFLICILFLLFDLEIGFVLPSLRRSSTLISFLLVLFFGLLLEYYFGGLDWLC